ncbi:MAG: rpsT [Thermoleophilia bacterium]|nr:rpsT [Thermoleophilia bacterium]
MANIKQQKKRIGLAQRQRMQNLRYRSTTKTLFNKLQLAVDTGDKDVAGATHVELVKLIDRSVTRGALHRNTAARKKARASRMLLQEAKTDAATTRKAKKKTTPVRKPKVEAGAKKPAAKKAPAKKAEAEAPVAEPEIVEETVEETAVEETPVAEVEAPAADATAEADVPAEDDAPAEDEAPAADEAPAEVADDAEATEPKE